MVKTGNPSQPVDESGPWITTVDCNYLHPRFACAYLLKDGDAKAPKATFIDNNTAHSVPKLLKSLADHGLKPKDVEYLIITHVHLDHAGGTGLLLQHCPNAVVLAHPKAARHIIDPSKLIQSAEAVYGRSRFQELYGEILPVPADRVRALDDGAVVKFGKRELQFLHTRGHANHHFCIWEEGGRNLFTGDAFGLHYPDLQSHGLFIFPSTSPTDFDPAAAIETVERLQKLNPAVTWLTHFGALGNVAEAGTQLKEHLHFSAELLAKATLLLKQPGNGAIKTEDLAQNLLAELRKYIQGFALKQGLRFDKKSLELLDLDLDLNAQGIAWVAIRAASQSPSDPRHLPQKK